MSKSERIITSSRRCSPLSVVVRYLLPVDCPSEEVLANLVDGKLAAGERPEVLLHLDGCGSCRFVVGALAQTQSVVEGGAPQQPIVPGTMVGRFRVVEELGSGGMGVVYAAHDPVLDRKVAIKLLKLDWAEGKSADEARARLLREGQVMARLQHPGVITVLDVGRWGDRDFIAMELIDGTTLGGWLKQPRTWREAVGARRRRPRPLGGARGRPGAPRLQARQRFGLEERTRPHHRLRAGARGHRAREPADRSQLAHDTDLERASRSPRARGSASPRSARLAG
jgi:hypothetical protein